MLRYYYKFQTAENNIPLSALGNRHPLFIMDLGRLRGEFFHKVVVMKQKFTHRGLRTPVYMSWCAMSQRCNNPNHTAYKDYGGRGIKVCERWRRFENFLEDMCERPKGMSLDRWPDKNGDYKPGNCRWATPQEQRLNSRPISCGPAKQRRFRAWHKNSVIQYLSNNQHEFARKHKLQRESISKCLLKKQKQHKGWKFELIKLSSSS